MHTVDNSASRTVEFSGSRICECIAFEQWGEQMRKLLAGAAAVALGLTAQGTLSPATTAAPALAAADRPAAGIAWSPCPDDDPLMDDYLVGLECGSLEVPLDHTRPSGQMITLALTRARHTAPES